MLQNKNRRVIFTTRNKKAAVKLIYQNVIKVIKILEEIFIQMLQNFLIYKELVNSKLADTKVILT